MSIIDLFFRTPPGVRIALKLALHDNERLHRRLAQLEGVVERQHESKTMSSELDQVERARLNTSIAEAHACAEASEKRVTHEKQNNEEAMRQIAALKLKVENRELVIAALNTTVDELRDDLSNRSKVYDEARAILAATISNLRDELARRERPVEPASPETIDELGRTAVGHGAG